MIKVISLKTYRKNKKRSKTESHKNKTPLTDEYLKRFSKMESMLNKRFMKE